MNHPPEPPAPAAIPSEMRPSRGGGDARAIRSGEPGFSPRILAEIAANNPKSCRLRRGRLRASSLHLHVLRHGLSRTADLVAGDAPDAARRDAQAVRELIRMFEG